MTIDEVRRLIDAVRTPHNRTYFWTVYSLGLRLQEGLNLQVGDKDWVVHSQAAGDGLVSLLEGDLPSVTATESTIRCPACGGPMHVIGFLQPGHDFVFDTN